MVSNDENGQRNSMMRTTSNFDTHIGVQQREKYFDRLGLDASLAGSGVSSPSAV
jgi:hypothetical protein